jgi:hypothetical protein
VKIQVGTWSSYSLFPSEVAPISDPLLVSTLLFGCASVCGKGQRSTVFEARSWRGVIIHAFLGQLLSLREVRFCCELMNSVWRPLISFNYLL